MVVGNAMSRPLRLSLIGALALAGCARKAATLPTDPIDRAAACSAIQAAAEQEAVGAAGHLSADAQGRVLHYALLAGSGGGRFDADTGNAVIKRTPALFDRTVKGEWKTLKPACAAAFPATAGRQPTLPDDPSRRALQCYVLVDFMRKALGQYGGRYGEDTVRLGVLADKLDAKVAPAVKRRGLQGTALLDAKNEALAAAAALGPPPLVIDQCGR